ncbi:MAG: AzlC family ABC transporter permease [Lachnospiraceae bacterium]|nr:AzlC family ABC transporter permease [Lachnospiraceae bacterium]MBQ2101846.1 AzlC family ABC transporter permease [Lachnospiraceae bacterium]MBQ3905980.1 AzlC family ABC transporter permease [Lachnospiraceae bacterium]
MKEFKVGLKDGIPIALGYFAVSFSLGITMVSAGMTATQGAVMSLSNLTSAGEFAGVRVIAAGGTLVELILTQLIINLRYSLMSLSLTQKLDEKVTLWQKLLIAFANTDEIFAVAMNHQKSLTLPYMLGLQSLPIVGWTAGTFLGAVAGGLMPTNVAMAMNVMLYGMFIAIVVPVAKKSRPVLIVACIAIGCSCLFRYVPLLNQVSEGISIIICTVVAAVLGAIFFPVKEENA